MSREFVHLHLHTEYSLLDGACRIEDIPEYAKMQGHSAVAITDHGSMFGVVNFYKSCKKQGIKPIIGCEVYLAPRDMSGRDKYLDGAHYHLILLVKNETGYKNLIYLVSKGYTEGFYSKPRIDMNILREHSEGLIALSACLSGYIPRAILSGNYADAEAHADEMLSVFGEGNYYLEIQNHGIEDQKTVNRTLKEIAEKKNIPLVATNDVHYLRRGDADAQAVLMCIQTNSVITDGRPMGFESNEFYYKSTDEMYELFSEYPGACENTVKIAEMCNFDFEFGNIKLPRFVPENGMKPGEYLRFLAYEGLEQRKSAGDILYSVEKNEEKYKDRIEYELSVIGQMGYDEYFLIVHDFVGYAKGHGIPVGPGRGSGAGSLVAFLLGITDIDSIKYDLIFERFLNPERVSMPDIDTDFCYIRRDEMISYVREKYGSDRAVQIITFGTLAARAAVRDAGRALGMSYADVDKVAREIPQGPGVTLKMALETNKNLSALRETPENRQLLDIAAAIEGMPRHASTHAAGVVISDRAITDYVPVSTNGDTVVTQYDMETIAELGLLKFDFLALRYLTIIDDTEKEIRRRIPEFDLTKVDINDSETYKLISSGQTDGVFQLESGGMKQMLIKLKPTDIEDIIAAIALYRPGPMDSIPKYIEQKHNPTKIDYKIPALEGILDVTHGCIVYQEQVMQIFRDVAGYSFGHADVVRRAISKKKQEVLLSERTAFVDGAVERGVDRENAAELFDDIVSFANYAFNRSHATAYGILSFRTAYLKAHYPAEYYSSLLTSVFGSADKIAEYSAECIKMGSKILPPDINESRSGFTVSDGNIRYGLLSIKNIGTSFISALEEERRRGGLFSDFDDFITRMKKRELNKKQLEMLIKAGALDSFGVSRKSLLAVYEKAIDNASSNVDEEQFDMFSSSGTPAPVYHTEFPELGDFTAKEKLTLEKESTGLYLSGHLMDDYSIAASLRRSITVSEIKSAFNDYTVNQSTLRDKSRVTVSGIITDRVNKITQNGNKMAFLSLEDKTGEIEVICFSSSIDEFGYAMFPGNAVCINGTITVKDEDDAKIIMKSAELLASNDVLRAENPKAVEALQTERAEQHPKAPTKIFLKVPSLSSEEYRKAVSTVEIFEGEVPVILYDGEQGKYITEKVYTCSGGKYVVERLRAILGDGNVVIK